ncbi:MAG TPA: polyprenyl synthetase family protein [Fermentimonas sp.]|nr:polyprenyl synthetase family protein [Fermentimonas sp.]
MNSRVNFLEKRINEELKRVLINDQPRTLFDPPVYVFSLGGKRIRPILALMAADLFEKDIEPVINPALAVEIFHNFSLLHDDLMDNADVRRGSDTVHKKWNENTAILSGDAMVIEAYRYVAKLPDKYLSRVLELFSKTAMEICIGQQYDMDFEQRYDVTEDEYLNMIKLKTAVLIGCSLKIGAIISDASKEDADSLYRFGINLGLAFQLKDDLLDVYGDFKTFGKKPGGDILSNKKTFLLIRALESSNHEQRKELEKWIGAINYNPDEKIAAVKNIYDELNLKSLVENLIEKYYLASLECLSSISVPDNRKKDLKDLSENLMYRDK